MPVAHPVLGSLPFGFSAELGALHDTVGLGKVRWVPVAILCLKYIPRLPVGIPKNNEGVSDKFRSTKQEKQDPSLG